MAITLQAHPCHGHQSRSTTPILSSAQRLEVLTGVRPLPGQVPFPGADILYVNDRASYQAVITRMRETLGELGRDGAEHQAL